LYDTEQPLVLLGGTEDEDDDWQDCNVKCSFLKFLIFSEFSTNTSYIKYLSFYFQVTTIERSRDRRQDARR
jgi:hypothetical protein